MRWAKFCLKISSNASGLIGIVCVSLSEVGEGPWTLLGRAVSRKVDPLDGVVIDSGVTVAFGVLSVTDGDWPAFRSDIRLLTFASNSIIRPAWTCRLMSVSFDHV